MAHRAQFFISTTVILTAGISTALAQQPQPEETLELAPIVVSASQVPVEADRTGSSVTVITGEEMEARGDRNLTDALRRVPGVAISAAGASGTLTELRIRGGETNHLLVLVDGVPVNGTDLGLFDFADFMASDIERVEVLRGPQSGIYGANAHSGVVSITTKSGRGEAPSFNAFIEGGSRGTGRAGASLRGSGNGFYGAANITGYRTDGYNIAFNGSERDEADATSLSGTIGVDPSENLNLEATARYTRRFAQNDAENWMTGIVEDAFNANDNEVFSGRVSASFKALDGRFINTTSVKHFEQNYSNDIGFGPWVTKSARTLIDNKASLSADSAFFGHERHTFTLLADHEWEEFNQSGFDGNRERSGLAGEWLVDFDMGLTLSAALRHDWNQDFDNATTWRLTGSQKIGTHGTRIHASVGRGVTNPSFFEQYGLTVFGNFVGNPDLKPESSIGWDAGVEQKFWNERITLDLTYFSSRFEDKIDLAFVPDCPVSAIARCPVNLDGTSKRDGIEFTASADLNDWLTLSGNYTYTRAKDPDGVTEVRRPRHSLSADVMARFAENKGRANLGLTWNGDRYDANSVTGDRLKLGGYTLVSGQVSYDVTKEVTVFARAENVLDQDYEEVFGYRAPGFAAYAGMKIALGRD